MNVYGILILCALVLHYLIELIADFLNIKALDPELPEEFRGVYDQQKYRRSQEYTRVKTRLGIVTATFDLLLLLVFWFTGGFNYLDQRVHALGLSPVSEGLVYIGVLLAAKTILSLPFGIYSTFVIEERFGFNRTTVRTFILDLLKGFALAIVLGGPLLAAILFFFTTIGSSAWIYCWLATTAFTLLIQFIAPIWIMPLFNKFTPLEEGELKTAILNYAKSVDFPLKNVFVVDGSRRSSKANAFFTGFGKNRRVALFDTLIEKFSPAELTAIVAHEIGHYKKRHLQKSMAIGILHLGVILYLLSIFLHHQGLFAAFFMDRTSIHAGLIFFSLLLTPLELPLGLIMNTLSRKHEFEADCFAVTTTGDGEILITALKKLAADNLANLTPHPLQVALHYSHPPMLQRINAIRRCGRVSAQQVHPH